MNWIYQQSQKTFNQGDRVELTGRFGRALKGAKGHITSIGERHATVRLQGSDVVVKDIPFERLKIPDVDKTVDTQKTALTGVIDRLLKSEAYQQAASDRFIAALDKSMLPDIAREYDQWRHTASGDAVTKLVVIIREFVLQNAYSNDVFYASVRILKNVGNRDAIEALRLLAVNSYTLINEDRKRTIIEALRSILTR